MILVHLPVHSQVSAYSAIVANKSERTFHPVMLDASIGHFYVCITAYVVAHLIAVLIVVNEFPDEIQATGAVVEVENRPRGVEVMVVVNVLLSLARKCIAEAVALSLYGAYAHYTSHLATIFGTGIAYYVYRLDVFRHEVAELGVVVHLSSVNMAHPTNPVGRMYGC